MEKLLCSHPNKDYHNVCCYRLVMDCNPYLRFWCTTSVNFIFNEVECKTPPTLQIYISFDDAKSSILCCGIFFIYMNLIFAFVPRLMLLVIHLCSFMVYNLLHANST